MSKIEWTDLTINPIVGCSKCSPGCDNCYAEKMAYRLSLMPATAAKYAGVVDKNGWTGKMSALDLTCFDRLPKKPCKVFVGSMTDLFFRGADDTHEQLLLTTDGKRFTLSADTLHSRVSQILLEVAKHKQHTFIFLTKRPSEMKETLSLLLKNPLPNLWLGITVCNQQEADKNIPLLLTTPAAKRFVSVEPMPEAVDLDKKMQICEFTQANPLTGEWEYEHQPCPNGTHGGGVQCGIHYSLDWVICGGETGPGARPMHPAWVESLWKQAHAAKVPFFFKGWGEFATDMSGDCKPVRVGKKAAGRKLYGVEWNEVPND